MNKLRLLLTLLVVSICSVHSAWADVEINETNFPDENFRNYLLNQTYGSDGVITDAEIAEVTSIDVSEGWYNIASLKGIEFFTALETLNCAVNKLTALDVSKNTALTTLNCGGNQLTALDVSKNTALTSLKCFSNQLTALDVSKNTALTELQCIKNQLTSLNVSGCTALSTLNCYANPLTSLNVSGCTALTELRCHYNQLTSLDVSGCTALTSLECHKNQLTALDVSGCTALSTLNCGNNQLTSLDVSGCTALSTLECDNNQLTTLDVSGCTALSTLNCGNNQLTTLDVSKNTALEDLSCSSNQLTTLDVSNNTALEDLYCGNNPLTTLDLSKNTALRWLSCDSNQLTALDVSKNTALTWLSCDSNRLTALNVSKNTALTSLYCSSNQIKGEAMDALVASLPTITSDNGSMYVIYFENEGNVMTAKQVAAAKAKGWTPYYCAGKIYQYGSEINNWQEYIGSEPEINETNFPDVNFRNWLLSQSYGSDGVITDAEIAEVTSIDVSSKSIASLKGIEFFTALTSLACSNNELTSLDVSKNTALTTLRCNNNIRLYGLDVSKNTTLTTLDVSGCSTLHDLDCSSNQLTTLDLSGCSALYDLDCSGNQLTALDLSNNTALKYLRCDNNQLTTLDVSNNTALTELFCSNNQLTALDVSKNAALTELICSNNQLTALGLSNNTALKDLWCYNNQLTTLNVSGCTALYFLWCYNNQLTTLDVSKNMGLSNLECYRNQIKGAAMDAFIESLPTKASGDSYMYVIYSENEGNVMTTAQVAAAKVKGWTPMYGVGVYENDLTWIDWEEYTGSEPVAIEPIEEETTVSFGGTSGIDESTDLSNTAVNDVLYTLDNTTGNGYDNTDQSITITSVVSDANIAEAEALTPGTPEFAEKFNGITIELAAGTGSVTFDCQTIGNRQLTVKIGNAPAATYSKSERGEVKVAYNVAAPTYMYVYATAVTGARGSEPTAIENALKLYGFTVKPVDPTAIESIESDASASKNGSDVYFDLSGRRVTAPTKGVYVKNGRKVVVK